MNQVYAPKKMITLIWKKLPCFTMLNTGHIQIYTALANITGIHQETKKTLESVAAKTV
jgi:hypothetical protein